LQAVAERMHAEQAAHVVVREADDGVAHGIVSSFDVAAVVGGHDPRTARLVRPAPAPARPAISDGRLDRNAVWQVMHRGSDSWERSSRASIRYWNAPRVAADIG
jgi:hypothetical protein